MLERVLDALAFPERAVHRTVVAAVLLMVVLSNGLGVPLFLLLRPPEGLQSLPGFLLAALPLEIVLIAFVGLAWRVRATRAGEGVAWPPLRQLPVWVLFGLLAGPLLLVIAAVTQTALRAVFGVEPTQFEQFLWIRELQPWQFSVVLLVVAVVAPVAEELFFRGFVFGAYLRASRPVWGYLVSGIVFALMHLNVPATPPIFIMGLVLAWLYHRTGSVLPSIVAHGFNNAIAFLVLYLAPLPF